MVNGSSVESPLPGECLGGALHQFDQRGDHIVHAHDADQLDFFIHDRYAPAVAAQHRVDEFIELRVRTAGRQSQRLNVAQDLFFTRVLRRKRMLRSRSVTRPPGSMPVFVDGGRLVQLDDGGSPDVGGAHGGHQAGIRHRSRVGPARAA
ncbi:hypothetical protein [Rhodanobacter sp. B05]|jgi:hypothetical protein|uniref:hypothetical protein n=1 Tax=Rhodanobacter sp. B05 TaxID=1945859 RepID=UPI0020C52E9B|nr:hypothetical protein [Rhodanobacter sp. B05]